MTIIELFLLAAALAMDAFAIAVCIGLAAGKFRIKNAIIVGLYFGVFQGLMPLIGFFAGNVFAERVAAFDHWIAFVLLTILGMKMIVGSLRKCDDSNELGKKASLGVTVMFPLAVATSIDALAAGVSFAFLQVDIVPAVVLIGAVTFVVSALGVKIGSVVEGRFRSKAEFAGGVVLVVLAVRALIVSL